MYIRRFCIGILVLVALAILASTSKPVFGAVWLPCNDPLAMMSLNNTRTSAEIWPLRVDLFAIDEKGERPPGTTGWIQVTGLQELVRTLPINCGEPTSPYHTNEPIFPSTEAFTFIIVDDLECSMDLITEELAPGINVTSVVVNARLPGEEASTDLALQFNVSVPTSDYDIWYPSTDTTNGTQYMSRKDRIKVSLKIANWQWESPDPNSYLVFYLNSGIKLPTPFSLQMESRPTDIFVNATTLDGTFSVIQTLDQAFEMDGIPYLRNLSDVLINEPYIPPSIPVNLNFSRAVCVQIQHGIKWSNFAYDPTLAVLFNPFQTSSGPSGTPSTIPQITSDVKVGYIVGPVVAIVIIIVVIVVFATVPAVRNFIRPFRARKYKSDKASVRS